MTITTTSLAKAAGVSAAIAGTIFIAVQVNHPPMEVASVETGQWVVRSAAKATMAAFALAGITGMYLRQVRRAGLLGLVGYLVLAVGYLLMFSVEIVATFVLPALTGTVPQFVDDAVVAAAGGHPVGDLGNLPALFGVAGVAYMAGGLLFGIALFRARVLARWASLLLAVGTTATVALAVLPESFNRPMAVPVGVALIGLGVSLWRHEHASTIDAPTDAVATAPAYVR
jgi:hypothetical protein